MRKMILTAVLLAFAAGGFAQQTSPSSDTSEWLPSFTSIAVDAALDVKFVKVPSTEAPKIVYNTKGSTTTKFKAEAKDKVLYITERFDAKRTDRTSVTVYYNEAQKITVKDAHATFEGVVTEKMLNLQIGGEAHLTAQLEVQDLMMELTGRSSVTLSGKVRYMTLYASTGKLEAMNLEVMSALVNVTASSAVSLWVTERFEAKTSTGGKITFKGDPAIVRTGSKFMGGDITHLK